VTASKRLLNDRLKITIGNNFEMGGQNPNRNQNTSVIPGNIAADYELSRTGRYSVRIYRQTENEDLIRGYVTQTGATFVLNAEYNRFRNLFVSRKKQLRRREERQRQRMQQNQQPPPPNTTALK
jgi:hypothetical protein